MPNLTAAARAWIGAWRRRRVNRDLPFAGFAEGRLPTPFVDGLSDADLLELNALLRWNCFTVDAHGRRFGAAAFGGKRCQPQAVPDPRIARLHERVPLTGKHVLEVGCFEGIHTLGLLRHAGRVTAVDARVENVVKTIVRCALFDEHPRVFVANIESEEARRDPRLRADVLWHVGVLYHLRDPVRHLLALGGHIGEAVLLDTHYSLPDEADQTYDAAGRAFRYKRYREAGHADVFSGVYEHAKWLTLDTLRALLAESGFPRVETLEDRRERNGPRALLLARR